jgi:hypothetical protein
VQSPTLAQLHPLLDCLMNLHATLPIHTPASESVDTLACYAACPHRDRLELILIEVRKRINNKSATLVMNSCPVHPLEVALGLSETINAHSRQDTMFQRRVVHELQFVSADVEVLRQCVLALQNLGKYAINIVEVNLAYGIPEGRFGGDVIFRLRVDDRFTDANMIRARFEYLPQLPLITWANVGWFSQGLSQFRTHQRIATLLMNRLGKEQQVQGVEMQNIVKCKESVEQGLILHPQFLRRFSHALRTVQVSENFVCHESPMLDFDLHLTFATICIVYSERRHCQCAPSFYAQSIHSDWASPN